MDFEKKMDSSAQSKRSCAGLVVAVVVLSLLLSATVSTIIFMSVTERISTQVKGEKISVDVNLNKDGNKMQEKISYDEKRDIAFTYAPNGEFVSAEDLNKGFDIIKDQVRGLCYVVPTGTDKQASKDVKKFIKDYDGKDINLEEKLFRSKIMPGEIRDESFLPDEAKEACDGFKWMSVVDDTEPSSETSMDVREKRDTEDCEYICWISARDLKLYIIYTKSCTRADLEPCYEMYGEFLG